MKFFVVIHNNGFDNEKIIGLSQTIEEGLYLYGIDPYEYNLPVIKMNKSLTLSITGECVRFLEVEYDDSKIQQYLREQKLKRI